MVIGFLQILVGAPIQWVAALWEEIKAGHTSEVYE
jgi:hypothetical protein